MSNARSRQSAATRPRPTTASPSGTRSPRSTRTARQRRQRRQRTYAAAAALVLLGAISLGVASRSSSQGYSTSSAAWVLPRLSGGGKVSLASLRGRPVVVNFFASWCQVCAGELPTFAHDATLLRGRVRIVEVNALETGNGPSFAAQFHLVNDTTAVLRDVGGAQGDGLYQSLGGSGSLPLTAFYSASGQLIDTHVGGFDSQTLAAALAQDYGIRV